MKVLLKVDKAGNFMMSAKDKDVSLDVDAEARFIVVNDNKTESTAVVLTLTNLFINVELIVNEMKPVLQLKNIDI